MPSTTRDSRCFGCWKFNIPALVCNQERVTCHRPFEKYASLLACYCGTTNTSVGKDAIYETLYTVVLHGGIDSRTTTELQQYADGPILTVECCEFVPENKNQIYVLEKNSSGWHSVKTIPYCLTDPTMDISLYIHDSVRSTIDKASRLLTPVSLFFRLARMYTDVSY